MLATLGASSSFEEAAMNIVFRAGLAALSAAALQGCNCGQGAGGDPLVTTWKYRYSCGSATSCFESDVCATEALAVDPSSAAQYKNADGTLTGTLEGNVFRWKARWGNPPYDEVGKWTFSSDWSSFTQVTCYTYDGTADIATTTCTGQNKGECSGSGAKASPAPPAAVGACPAGSGSKTCN